MKQYQTKTGVILTCIQGQGLGDGVRRGVLTLVPSSGQASGRDLRALDLRRQALGRDLRDLYKKIGDCLSLKQYKFLMGGSSRYADKARRAMKVSQNKTVHGLAARILEIDAELSQIETIYPRGA